MDLKRPSKSSVSAQRSTFRISFRPAVCGEEREAGLVRLSLIHIFSHAAHPYTQALLSAVPILSGHEKRERIILKGEVPGAAHIPSGCRFHTRCPMATKECAEHEPELREVASGHMAACHRL